MYGAYIMSVFGEGLCTGHHGCCSFLQLSQFLPSLVQRYPGTSQISHHAGRCSLHALHAAWAGDVLGQATGSLTSSCLADYQRRNRKRQNQRYSGIQWKSVCNVRKQRDAFKLLCTHRDPLCPETELLHQKGL